MRYWTFDANTCRFKRAAGQVALQPADDAIFNNGNEVTSRRRLHDCQESASLASCVAAVILN